MSDVVDHDRGDRPWYAQPAPRGGTGPPVQQLVLDDVRGRGWPDVAGDMLERWCFGRRKYGNGGLLAHDGRRTDGDAYAEALDLAFYCRKGLAEGDLVGEEYELALELCRRFRTRLARYSGGWL